MAKSTRRKKKNAVQEPTNVVFEYIKSQHFRVIHADGAIGGITPSGNVHVAFYSERPAIPRMMVHEANPDGSLGKLLPEQTVKRPGVIREMDVDVVLNLSGVESLLVWLKDRKKELVKIKKQLSDKEEPSGVDKKTPKRRRKK